MGALRLRSLQLIAILASLHANFALADFSGMENHQGNGNHVTGNHGGGNHGGDNNCSANYTSEGCPGYCAVNYTAEGCPGYCAVNYTAEGCPGHQESVKEILNSLKKFK